MRHIGPLAATCLLGVVALVSSCSNASDRQHAFQAYMAQVTSWAPVDAETARSIQRIFATQFVDEPAIRQEVGQTAPRIQAHLERIDAARPDTPELRSINGRYRAAYAALKTALESLPPALDRGDASALADGRRQLTAWERAMVDVATDLRRLQPESHLP